ncbi:MAG TPA: hypothetical protein VG796_25935 [Verrucomicrobiales bacterium]|nr:hypothetical protein [Verrucomicrobiales bacterium]
MPEQFVLESSHHLTQGKPMPSKDPSRAAKKAVDKLTGQREKFDAGTILEDPALRARLRDAKEALAKERLRRKSR